MATLRGIWILPINWTDDVIMTSNYAIVFIKLYYDVENDEYIILCNFGGRFGKWARTKPFLTAVFLMLWQLKVPLRGRTLSLRTYATNWGVKSTSVPL